MVVLVIMVVDIVVMGVIDLDDVMVVVFGIYVGCSVNFYFLFYVICGIYSFLIF